MPRRQQKTASDNPVMLISCDGAFEMEVKAESHYQDAIGACVSRTVVEQTSNDACRCEFSLRLVREPANPYDTNAIAVKSTDGRTLGHLAREEAARCTAPGHGWRPHAKLRTIIAVAAARELAGSPGRSPKSNEPRSALTSPIPSAGSWRPGNARGTRELTTSTPPRHRGLATPDLRQRLPHDEPWSCGEVPTRVYRSAR